MSVRLAHRTQRTHRSSTVAMTARAARLREQGRDIIALSAGEPDFDTPEHVKAAAVAAIRRGDTKYPAIDGTHELKRAIVAKLVRDNTLEYDVEQVLVSSGAKQSCYNACQALLEAGDEAIVPAPYWVSYPEMVRLADAEPVIVHATAEHGFRMSPEQLEAAITPQTRVVFLNSPCNPSGAVYSADDWRGLGEVLRDHPRVVVIADDIYEHIHWDETPFTSIAAACPHLYERTLTVNGLSKCYAMSGWRIGYAAGPESVIKAMTSIQSQSTTNACTISQAAAVAALDGDQSFVTTLRDVFRERHDLVVRAMQRIRGFECRPAQGTFYVFPRVVDAMRIKGSATDTDLCERVLEETGVALVPGTAFGAPGHLRMSFAAAQSTLEEALGRLEGWMSV